MNPFCKARLSALALVQSCAALLALPVLGAPAEPAVTIAANATLAESLSALRRSTGFAVLSEIPAVHRKLDKALNAAPLSEALLEVSRAFQLHFLRQGNTLVFLRRYTDPRELCSLEIEEITAITADLYRLVNGYAPGAGDYYGNITSTRDSNDFVKRFSPRQAVAMQAAGGGLAFRELKPEQQSLWLKINGAQAYGNLAMEGRRQAQMFRVFKQGSLAYLTLPTQIDGGQVVQHTGLFWRYPDPHPESLSNGGFGLHNLSEDTPPGRGGALGAGRGETLPPIRSRLPQRFRQPLTLSGGEAALGKLVTGIGSAAGAEIRLAAHVRGRRLLAFADGAPAGDVAAGLELMYGWELRAAPRGRYLLDRPTPAPAADAIDLQQKLRSLFPPTTRLMWSREGTTPTMRMDRYSAQKSLIWAELTKRLGSEWKHAAVADMPPALQQHVANWVFDLKLYSNADELLTRQQPSWCVADPQSGRFTLSGPLGPGLHPTLMFNVQRPDGKVDSWGWFVGSSSLE